MEDLKRCISPIGFGAFKIGRNQGIKYEHAYELPDDAAAEQLLNGILDLGVTYVDTAPAYGLSEERIGRFLSHRRAEFVLSTKVGEHFENGQSTYDFSAESVRLSIERSLRRLRTNVVDIVFVHAPRNDLSVFLESNVIDTLSSMRDRGDVRAIGFSGYTAEAFIAAMDCADALMLEYHPQNRALEPVISQAASRGKLVMVKKGLAGGRIAGDQPIEFVLSNPAVTSLVIGSMNLQHMATNVCVGKLVRDWHSPRENSPAPDR